MPILASLDKVDWEKLSDAYGPSVDTPEHIRDLISPDDGRREEALDELFSSIYHQGTVYAASVAAVPFLLEIVAATDVPARTPALQLLQALATGSSYHEAHAGLIFNREESKTPEWQAKVVEEKSWVAAIRERISEGVPLVVEVLRRGREEERLAAASLLATIPENPKATEALLEAAASASPTIGAAAIMALGSRDNAPIESLLQAFDRATNELVRLVAAIQIVGEQGSKSPSAPIELLISQLRSPQPELRKVYEALPDAGAFLGDVGQALACGPDSVVMAAFPLLYEQVKASPYPLNDSENFGILILAVKLNPPANHNWVAASMAREQRLAIRLIADRAWSLRHGERSISVNLVELLESVGLPGKREAVFELLAGTPEGVQTPAEQAAWSAKPKRPWWKFFG